MKNIIVLILALYGLSFNLSAQVEIPESVPFGPLATFVAMTQIKEYEAKVYTYPNGVRTQVGYEFEEIEPFSTFDELAEQFWDFEFDFEVDPRLEIFIEVTLQDDDEEELFVSERSFFLDVIRDENGAPIDYKVPGWAGSLHFRLAQVRIPVEGVGYAVLLGGSKDQTLEIDVDGDGVLVPGVVAISDYWHTLELTFEDGQVVKYDRMGQRVINMDFEGSINGLSFNNIRHRTLRGSRFEYNNSDPWGHNPVIALRSEYKGFVTFDIHPYERPYTRPAYIWVSTIDNYNAGAGFYVYEYNRFGYNYSPDFTIQVPLEADTEYYIIIEWHGEVNVESGRGGKG
jgi:hypothetical protein